MNALSEALQSGAVLLREGLEALLVIAALAAFLIRAGVPEKVKSLYIGAGLAIVASIGAAVVFELFFEGEHNDFVEAGVMVVAAALMLYMSGWMFLKQDPKAWLAALRRAGARLRHHDLAGRHRVSRGVPRRRRNHSVPPCARQDQRRLDGRPDLGP